MYKLVDKNVTSGLQETKPCLSPGSNGSVFPNTVFTAT